MNGPNTQNEGNEKNIEKFEKLRIKYEQYKNDLEEAIEVKDSKLITLYRGRLIKTISKMLSSKITEQLEEEDILALKTELQSLIKKHKAQLNSRIDAEKTKNSNFSIPKEIGLKIKRTASSVKEIKAATDGKERVGAVLKTTGNGLSTLFSVSKLALKPAGFVVQKAAGAATYLAGYAVALPVNIMTQLLGKIVNPDRPLSLEASKQFGGILKDITEDTIEKINEGIIKL